MVRPRVVWLKENGAGWALRRVPAACRCSIKTRHLLLLRQRRIGPKRVLTRAWLALRRIPYQCSTAFDTTSLGSRCGQNTACRSIGGLGAGRWWISRTMSRMRRFGHRCGMSRCLPRCGLLIGDGRLSGRNLGRTEDDGGGCGRGCRWLMGDGRGAAFGGGGGVGRQQRSRWDRPAYVLDFPSRIFAACSV